jgi:HAD superfamily hydrolase (TIGR01509 family)
MILQEDVLSDFAVIFDSDGVIVDSEHFSLAAFREAMEEQDVVLSDKDIMANCGLTDADIIAYVLDKYDLKIDSAQFHHRKHELYEMKVREGNLQACKGAAALLDELSRNKVPFALASSGSIKKISFNLSRIGLMDKFPVIVSGENMEKGKPHPDIFLAAAERLNISPSRCVVFEDSKNGILAAKRAGMFCVAVAGTFSEDALRDADFIVDSLDFIDVEKIQNFVNNKKHFQGGKKC